MARAAVLLDHRRLLNQALDDVNTALRLEPGQLEARMDRSLVLSGLKRDREALNDLDQVLADPRAPTRVYFMRATVRQRLGDAVGAKQDRERGLKTPPNDAASWVARGVERVPTDPAGALSDFVQAQRLNPRSIHALRNQSYILGEVQKKPAEAIAVLDRLLEFHPTSVVDRISRGVYLARQGRAREALREADACLQLSSQPDVLYRAACIYALASEGDARRLRESCRLLANALVGGWGYEWVLVDDDLAALRKQAGFPQLLEAVKLLQTWQQPAQ
jgi:tetratricopeptide (TPR) repeat protein